MLSKQFHIESVFQLVASYFGLITSAVFFVQLVINRSIL
jgi:hypothetical protein